jgi:hypothetical protein
MYRVDDQLKRDIIKVDSRFIVGASTIRWSCAVSKTRPYVKES